MTPVQKLAGLVVLILMLMASAAGVTWQVQEWRMGKRLACTRANWLPSARPPPSR